MATGRSTIEASLAHGSETNQEPVAFRWRQSRNEKRETKIEYSIVYGVRRITGKCLCPELSCRHLLCKPCDQSERGAQLQGFAWADQRLCVWFSAEPKALRFRQRRSRTAPHVVFRRITNRSIHPYYLGKYTTAVYTSGYSFSLDAVASGSCPHVPA